MNDVILVPVVLAVLLAIVALAFAVVVMLSVVRRARGIEVIATGPMTLDIRTPYGKGSARLVVTEEHGRVYEVTTSLRGEGPSISYVPPTAHLVRAHLAQRVDALDVAPRRSLARRR